MAKAASRVLALGLAAAAAAEDWQDRIAPFDCDAHDGIVHFHSSIN